MRTAFTAIVRSTSSTSWPPLAARRRSEPAQLDRRLWQALRHVRAASPVALLRTAIPAFGRPMSTMSAMSAMSAMSPMSPMSPMSATSAMSGMLPALAATPALPAPPSRPVAPASQLLYDADGRLDSDAMGTLLKTLDEFLGDYRRVARRDLSYLADMTLLQAQKRTRHLQRKLAAMPQLVDSTGQRESVYGGLKSIAFWLRVARAFNPRRAASTLALRELADTVTQMARVEFNRHGVRTYDAEADAASRRLLTAMPTFQGAMSHNVEQTHAAGLKLAMKFGFKGAVGVEAANNEFVNSDLDGDMILGKLRTTRLAVSAGFGAGEMGFRAINMTLEAGMSETRGELFETTTVPEAMRLRARLQRDGIRADTSRSDRLTSPDYDRFSGEMLSKARKLRTFARSDQPVPVQRATQQRVNASATGIGVTVRRAFRQAWFFFARQVLAQGLSQDTRPELTSEKLQKGAVPETVPRMLAESERYHEFDRAASPVAAEKSGASFATLQATVLALYSGLPQQKKPAGFQRHVLSGVWLTTQMETRFDASFLQYDAVQVAGRPLISAGGSVAVSGQLQRRSLPLLFWMAPHETLGAGVAHDITVTWRRLAQTFEKNPVIAWLPQRFQNDLASQKTDVAAAVGQLGEVCDAFEKNARALLAGHAMALSRQGTADGGQLLAQDAFDNMLALFFPNLAGNEQRRLRRMSIERPEEVISACWNALSLCVAAVQLHPVGTTAPVGPEALKTALANSSPATIQAFESLKSRVKDPDILLAPEVLYRNVVVMVTADVQRTQVRAGFDLRAGIGLQYGAAQTDPGIDHTPIGAMSGGIGVQLGAGVDAVYMEVAEHPNPVRNGKFLSLSLKFHDQSVLELPVRKLFAILNSKYAALGRADILTAGAEMEATASLLNLSIVRGATYFLQLHLPEGTDKWNTQYLQRVVTHSRSAKLSIPLSASGTQLGASVTPSLSASSAISQPTHTVFGNDPAIHFLQLPVLLGWLEKIGMLDHAEDKLQFPACFKEAGGARELIIERYFSGDCMMAIVGALQQLKSAALPTVISNDFDKLACEEFSTRDLEAWRAEGPNADALAVCLGRAGPATRDLSAQERFAYFLGNPDGRIIMSEYVEGMRRFNAMKVLSYFNPGKRVTACSIKTHAIDGWIARKKPAPVSEELLELQMQQVSESAASASASASALSPLPMLSAPPALCALSALSATAASSALSGPPALPAGSSAPLAGPAPIKSPSPAVQEKATQTRLAG